MQITHVYYQFDFYPILPCFSFLSQVVKQVRGNEKLKRSIVERVVKNQPQPA